MKAKIKKIENYTRCAYCERVDMRIQHTHLEENYIFVDSTV